MGRVVINCLKGLGIVALLICGKAYAQEVVPPLERIISVELNDLSAKESLKLFEEQGEFTFAYRTDLIDNTQRYSRTYSEKAVREILDDMFRGTVIYREKGNYILLRNPPKTGNQEVVLEGYVLNAHSNEKIPYASIYDTTTLLSAVTDEFGHFTLALSTKNNIVLKVRKAGFQDTTFAWIGENPNVFNVRIQPIVKPVEADTLPNQDTLNAAFYKKLNELKFFKLSDEQKANLQNFKDKLSRRAQVSIVPGVGTNGKLSGVTTVDYSFNLLGGFNGGVRVAEIGFLFNMDWDSVRYFQAAGLFNAVGGPQNGTQLAGFANLNKSSFKGAQLAGFMNIVGKDLEGVQLAGFSNMGNTVSGVQGAGFMNMLKDSSNAVQLSGFGNFANNSNSGVQAAGFMNVARKEYKGGQIAGFGNYVGNDAKGVQLAGFMNVAGKNYQGTQLSGFINVAGNIKGTQLGFINVNDSIDGVPIGFFTFSRKGYHQLEISANEVFPVNVAFKTGTYQFYNTFSSGAHFAKSTLPTWNLGYGIGSSVRVSSRSRIFFDLQAQALQRGTKTFSDTYLDKFTVSYHFSLWDKVVIAAGPSLNVLFVNEANTYGSELNDLVPYTVYKGSVNASYTMSMWIGGHLALRFF